MHGSYLGPSFSNQEIEEFLNEVHAPFLRLSEEVIYKRIANDLAAEKVVGWFPGRMKFGPRAMVAAAGLVVPALLLPKILGPVYRVWMAFGHILGCIHTLENSRRLKHLSLQALDDETDCRHAQDACLISLVISYDKMIFESSLLRTNMISTLRS